MSLEVGQKLGPYQIEEHIGAGGMGEVYKATDTRLERTVAVKVLPQSSVISDDMRARFEREAKTISSLNHPHICTLHDIGHEDGIDYLVMELLEGETLESRISQGRLSTSDALRIGTEIAGALDAAHSKGLIHRDLKPSNVFLTKDGAKLLDFGLAKLSATAGTGITDKTHTTPVTGANALIGTMQYMSPEQLESKEADARSDIFAFGATLYEMLSGQRAFSGESSASIIGAIMKEEPRSITELLPTSPPPLDRAIKKCLQKDPDRRWQTARDLKDELEWIAHAGSQAGVARSVSVRRKFRFRLSWGLTVICATLAIVLAVLHFTREVPELKTSRFAISVPENVKTMSWPQLSPDGQYLAFLGTDTSGQKSIWIRPLNSLIAYPIPGTDDCYRPFWSFDSKSLAYFNERRNMLYRVPVAGGRPQVICQTGGVDGSWGKENYILFDRNHRTPIRLVSASGGTPRDATVINEEAGERYHSWPCFLPDGRHFLFNCTSDSLEKPDTDFYLCVGDIDNLENKRIGVIQSRAIYCDPGFVLFRMGGLLMAQRIDPGSFELVGDPITVNDYVNNVPENSSAINIAASNNGTLVTLRNGKHQQSGESFLVWTDRQGNIIDTIGQSAVYIDLVLSHDGTKLAYTKRVSEAISRETWIRDLKTGADRKLTVAPYRDIGFQTWSYDDSMLAFLSYFDEDSARTFIQRADQSSEPVRIPMADSIAGFIASWLSDNRMIYVAAFPKDHGPDMYIFPSDKPEDVQLLIGGESAYIPRGTSPNGKYLLYEVWDSTGNGQGFVMNIADQERWQLWNSSGNKAAYWRADGREIYFFEKQDLYATSVSYENGIKLGKPHRLFTIETANNFWYVWTQYSVTPDGERFLFAIPVKEEDQKPDQFEIVFNWYQELENK